MSMFKFYQSMKRYYKIVKKALSFFLVIGVVLFLWKYCSSDEQGSGIEIVSTPLKVEQIREIAELATVVYQDEVVVDTVEYYQSSEEQISGNLAKLSDPNQFQYGVTASAIKRRLTLVVQGELRLGFRLDSLKQSYLEKDSVWLFTLPEPVVLDVITNPSTTRVFVENGRWSDWDFSRMQLEAKRKMIRNAKQWELKKQAKIQIQSLFFNLLPNQKIRLEFVDNKK